MKCPKCHSDCPPEFDFCPRCAAPLHVSCPHCGFRAPTEFAFCPKCGAALPPGAGARPAAQAIADRLQRLVPKEYAQRLLATRGQVPSERRLVTILFSDVKGSTAMAENLDPEDWAEIMDGAFDVLIAPICRYEGTLARLMGDAILAFFGAPIAHEDDPERACRAALEITTEAQRYTEKLKVERGIEGFAVRVGINTGLVVMGEVGSDLRVEYTAMGDAINLAARMEQNAPPGGILITHDTYRHVRGVFNVLPQEPLSVKGKREPVLTYLVQRAKPRAFRKPMRGVEGIETRMIGRQAELNRLPLQDRTVLQQAAVVGRLFWDRAVAHISESTGEGVSEAEVLNSLSALRGREMVFQRETTTIAGAQEYIFKHAVLRDVTYESVLKRLRRTYHGLVADWLMAQAGERAGEYTGLIADHLELAGRTEEAANYLIEAGDRARGLYAHQEAIGAYQRALALLKEQDDHQRAARTWMKLGLTYHTAFDFRRAHQAYQEGFLLWQRASAAKPASLPLAPRAFRSAYADPLTLDPTRVEFDTCDRVVRQLFSGLLECTPQMDVVPCVARSWEVSQAGRKYTFHLRDDFRWSDGAPVTAHDFEFAWKRALDPACGSPKAVMLYDIRGARAFHQGGVSDPRCVGYGSSTRSPCWWNSKGPVGTFCSCCRPP